MKSTISFQITFIFNPLDGLASSSVYIPGPSRGVSLYISKKIFMLFSFSLFNYVYNNLMVKVVFIKNVSIMIISTILKHLNLYMILKMWALEILLNGKFQKINYILIYLHKYQQGCLLVQYSQNTNLNQQNLKYL